MAKRPPRGKGKGSRRSPPSRPSPSLPLLPHAQEEAPQGLSRRTPTEREVREWYEKAGAPGDLSGDPRDLAHLLSYGPSHVPFTYAWTDNRVEQVRHFKHHLYVAIHNIASKVAEQIPNVSWVTSTRGKDSGGEWQDKLLRQKALTPLLTHERLDPVPDSHPLLRLLKDPNDPDCYFDFLYETVLFLLLTGNAYWWCPKNALGLPEAMWVVPSHWMWPIMGGTTMVEAYEIRPVEGNYLRRRIPADQVIHVKYKNPLSKIDGYSPTTAVSYFADINEAVQRSTWHTYRNGTFPTVAVQFDGSLNDVSDEDVRRIEAKFYQRYVGETRANKPLLLPPGVTVRPLQIKPNEMIFGGTAEETRDNIYEGLGYYPGMKDFRGRPLEAMTALCELTLNPLCRFLGMVLTEKLARMYPQDGEGSLRVWWEGFRVNNAAQTNEDIKTDLLAGAICPNEVRVLRGREPWAGEYEKFGVTPIVPVNMEPGSLPGGGAHEPGDNNDDGAEMPELNDEDTK